MLKTKGVETFLLLQVFMTYHFLINDFTGKIDKMMISKIVASQLFIVSFFSTWIIYGSQITTPTAQLFYDLNKLNRFNQPFCKCFAKHPHLTKWRKELRYKWAFKTNFLVVTINNSLHFFLKIFCIIFRYKIKPT